MSITECHTAAEVRALAIATTHRRQAFFAPAKIPPQRLAPLVQTVLQPIPPTPLSKIDEIVEAIASAFNVSRETILTGIDPLAMSGRRLAVALCIRRLSCTKPEIIAEFGVSDGTAIGSLKALDPILTAYAISSRSELSSVLPIIYSAWIDQGQLLPQPINIDDIQTAVCHAFKLKKTELLSSRRTREVCYPRQVAMALSKYLTSRSLPEIGRKFGNKDHTTVLHAVRKYRPLIDALEKMVVPGSSLECWAEAAKRVFDAQPKAQKIK